MTEKTHMKESHLVGAKDGRWFKASHLLVIKHPHGKCQEALVWELVMLYNDEAFVKCMASKLRQYSVGYLNLLQEGDGKVGGEIVVV